MNLAGRVNIYPAEVEKALVQHFDVVNAAVIGIPDPTFGERPLAFAVRRPFSDVDDDREWSSSKNGWPL